MHSAKEVIYNELIDQYKDGKLPNLDLSDEINNSQNFIKDKYGKLPKQYKITYVNNETNDDCQMIIGTIDSFMYAIKGNGKITGRDFFSGLVKSIKNGNIDTGKNGNIKFSKSDITLNKKCLIIIDEAQDLDPDYIHSLCCIMMGV